MGIFETYLDGKAVGLGRLDITVSHLVFAQTMNFCHH